MSLDDLYRERESIIFDEAKPALDKVKSLKEGSKKRNRVTLNELAPILEKYDRLQAEIEVAESRERLQAQAQAEEKQKKLAAQKAEQQAREEKQKKPAASKAQQPRIDYWPSSVPDRREDYDDYLYRGAVQQEDARRREQSHQRFHRDFPGLDCNRERR